MVVVTRGLSEIKLKYALLEVIGSGSFGTVRKCRHIKNGQLFAVKTINKQRIENVDSLRNEIELLCRVKHPHIIDLVDVYEDESSLHIVTELCTGGELYDRVIEKADSPSGHFDEQEAACCILDILDAIAYCHDEVKIVHRDLKPENFLLKDRSENAKIKIIDFGLSRRDNAPKGVMSTRVGTPYYVAPEVLKKKYTNKCDIWSIGVISYILLCGFPPFTGETDVEIMAKVSKGQLAFPSPEWDDISTEAKEFVISLLQLDPAKRPTAKEAMSMTWIVNNTKVHSMIKAADVGMLLPAVNPVAKRNLSQIRPSHTLMASRQVNSSSLRLDGERRNAFQKFLANIKMRKTLGTISEVLTPVEADLLGDIFRQVDHDGDGHIDSFEIEKAVNSGQFSASMREQLKDLKRHLSVRGRVDVTPFVKVVETAAKKPREGWRLRSSNGSKDSKDAPSPNKNNGVEQPKGGKEKLLDSQASPNKTPSKDAKPERRKWPAALTGNKKEPMPSTPKKHSGATLDSPTMIHLKENTPVRGSWLKTGLLAGVSKKR